jgi:hypothetical protein
MEPGEQRVEADLEPIVAADLREGVGVPYQQADRGLVKRPVEQPPVTALSRVGGVYSEVELDRSDMNAASGDAAAAASPGLSPAPVNRATAYSSPASEFGLSRSVPRRSETTPGCRRRCARNKRADHAACPAQSREGPYRRICDCELDVRAVVLA